LKKCSRKYRILSIFAKKSQVQIFLPIFSPKVQIFPPAGVLRSEEYIPPYYLPQVYSDVPSRSPITLEENIPIIEYKVKLVAYLWAGGTKVDYKSMHNFLLYPSIFTFLSLTPHAFICHFVASCCRVRVVTWM
jgi:hypothetical protein